MDNCKTAKDCFDCGKYFSSHSSRYSEIYKTKVIEITCQICGHKVFEDNDENTGKRMD